MHPSPYCCRRRLPLLLSPLRLIWSLLEFLSCGPEELRVSFLLTGIGLEPVLCSGPQPAPAWGPSWGMSSAWAFTSHRHPNEKFSVGV